MNTSLRSTYLCKDYYLNSIKKEAVYCQLFKAELFELDTVISCFCFTVVKVVIWEGEHLMVLSWHICQNSWDCGSIDPLFHKGEEVNSQLEGGQATRSCRASCRMPTGFCCDKCQPLKQLFTSPVCGSPESPKARLAAALCISSFYQSNQGNRDWSWQVTTPLHFMVTDILFH